jgi:hypothetical protein
MQGELVILVRELQDVDAARWRGGDTVFVFNNALQWNLQ